VTFITYETLKIKGYEKMVFYLYGFAGSFEASLTTTLFSAALTAKIQA